MEDVNVTKPEIQESQENTEQDAMQSLEQATFEPGSQVEQMSGYQQAESIQADVASLVPVGAAAMQTESLQPDLPVVEAMLPATSEEISGVSVTPINVPLASPGEVSSQEVTLESPLGTPPLEQVGNLPGPIPDIAATSQQVISGAEAVEVDPTPLPDQGHLEEAVVTSATSGVENFGSLPIPVPNPAQLDEMVNAQLVSVGSEVSDLPLPMPDIAMEAGPVTDGEGVQTNQVEPNQDISQVNRAAGLQTGNMQEQVGEAAINEAAFEKAIPYTTDSAARVAGTSAEVLPSSAPVEITGEQQKVDLSGLEVPLETAARVEAAASSSEGTASNEGSEWKPPTMYVNTNPDGSTTVVGADGKAINSPPMITQSIDAGGQVHYYATYPNDSGADLKFEIPSYSAPLTGMYVSKGADGTLQVVDANGKPVDAPPTIHTVIGSDGKPVYMASYPGGEGILKSYIAPISDMYVYKDKDGVTHVVDANGKPVSSPPSITVSIGQDGNPVYTASYPGSDAGPVNLSAYSQPLSGVYFSKDVNGNTILVDEHGMKLASPPIISKSTDSSGKEVLSASYPGGQPVDISTLPEFMLESSGSGWSSYHVWFNAENKPVVVDGNGNPLDAQPKLSWDSSLTCYRILPPDYPAHPALFADVYYQPYSSLFIHLGQDGKPNVVDASGKPVTCPPSITASVNAAGQTVYTAHYNYYPSATLSYYKPPSAN